MFKRIISFLAPRLTFYALIVVAGLAAWGWIKPFLRGPDVNFTTLTRVRPAPVKVETVKWLTKVDKQIVRQRVDVPVEVIREVPANVEKRIEEEFHTTLPKLHEEGRELVDILDVPKAPHGGAMAITANPTSGKIEGIFRAKPMPFVEFGGMREVGLDYLPLHPEAQIYYRQDLVRVGPGIVNVKAFAGVPLAPSAGSPTLNYGASIGVAVRF